MVAAICEDDPARGNQVVVVMAIGAGNHVGRFCELNTAPGGVVFDGNGLKGWICYILARTR